MELAHKHPLVCQRLFVELVSCKRFYEIDLRKINTVPII